MSRPRKADALSSAERVRRYRERQKSVTKTQSAVTETQEFVGFVGSFCSWFPWAKDCTLDKLQKTCRSPWNMTHLVGPMV